MARLSRATAPSGAFDVIVIGSGYGGGISASRLARAGLAVCVLERGKEFQPGEYPDTIAEANAEMQVDTPHAHVGSRTGLYDFRANPEMNVFLGCGLGGTSLVNANVSLQADPRVFAKLEWPAAIRADAGGLLRASYDHAIDMLKPTPYPGTPQTLLKLLAMRDSATAINAPFSAPPINVNFTVTGPNHVGVVQQPCTLCGDCVSGCNHAAKNTVLMNYLPDAVNHGAQIFTRVGVRFVERAGDTWNVHYTMLDSGQERFNAPTSFISARIVVISAGALGSTEILLRSRERGLPLSDRVGAHFTGNGDVLAFAYNNRQPIEGIGFGQAPVTPGHPVGPCITGLIDLRGTATLEDGMVIEEGSIPGAMAPLLPGGTAFVAHAFGRETATSLHDRAQAAAREAESAVHGAYAGAVRNTQTFLVMTHDDGRGSLALVNDRLRIAWPGLGSQSIFRKVEERLMAITRHLGGTFVNNPIWSQLLGRQLITVHPLGGCVMADEAADGVVNHKGQVFAGPHGSAVHDGLYVADGSIVPTPLGVNPLLTISALSERNAALLAQDLGKAVDYAFPFAAARTAAAPPPHPASMGVQFTETMRGFVSNQVADDYLRAETRGRQDGSPMSFTMTIASDDLDDMLANEAHRARMSGTVTAPALSPAPLTVVNGTFNLFVRDPTAPESRQMRYAMTMTADNGATFYMYGFKQIHDDRRADMWNDTTTLFVTVYDGADDRAPVWGKGVLHILPQDFAVQMTTMQITNAANYWQRLEATARFGRFFAGTVYDTYGGVFARPSVFDPQAPPRKKRPLRLGQAVPELRYVTTDDGVQIQLTRYKAGTKGPVILSHGLGVSSLIFSIDTLDTSLLEYLVANEYDVWLLDFRASIELPASRTQFDGDMIATRDYPAAVRAVQAATGAPSVQMIVHCFGSTTFFMAMLAGLQGVRSIVASQVAIHMKTAPATAIATGLHLPQVLRWAGVTSLTALSRAGDGWRERLLDEALRFYPVTAGQTCQSAACHRITFMYSELYRHEQLNDATHAALHEMFGIANIRAFEHLATLVNAGHLVAFDGTDAYMPHLDRLAVPILFVQGEKNHCFLPESTERTLDLLSSANGSQWYKRQIVPGYGHIDCIFGRNAVNDVYPLMLNHLEATQ
jgi:cholesterol oxidase